MLTAFGKLLRKIRIDRDELLRDMAKRLGVSPAFLSAVENGKKSIPDAWVSKIAEEYALSRLETEELEYAKRVSVRQVTIRTEGLSPRRQEMLLSFARRFDSIDDESIDAINKILKE